MERKAFRIIALAALAALARTGVLAILVTLAGAPRADAQCSLCTVDVYTEADLRRALATGRTAPYVMLHANISFTAPIEVKALTVINTNGFDLTGPFVDTPERGAWLAVLWGPPTRSSRRASKSVICTSCSHRRRPCARHLPTPPRFRLRSKVLCTARMPCPRPPDSSPVVAAG